MFAGIRSVKQLVRYVSCRSCGVELQSKNPSAVGYYQPARYQRKVEANAIENLKYVMFTQELQNAKHEMNILDPDTDPESNRDEPKRLICRRCVDALSQNKYEAADFPLHSFQDVKEVLPRSANVYHVASLADFPLSLDKAVLSGKNNNNHLLLSKADQITYKSAMLPHKGSAFFTEFCRKHLGVNVKKVVLFSSTRNWNMPSVLNSLAKKCYLLGNPNVGKTSLINSLLHETKSGFQALTDKAGNVIGPSKGHDGFSNLRRRIKFNEGGVSHIPNFTRSMQTYQINDVVMHDLPGYTMDSSKQIRLEDIIEKKTLDLIRKTSKFKLEKLIRQNYISLKGTSKGRCLSFQGIFNLVAPPSTINQVINYIPVAEREFSNVQKAVELSSEVIKTSDHPLTEFFSLKEPYTSMEQLSRHVIPPFQGSIEVVLKDIGYFQLRSTGKYSFNGLYELWAPKGIKVCIREPLSKIISINYDKFIETKNLADLCPADRPIVSDTYIMDHDEIDTFQRMREMYLDRTRSDLSSRRLTAEDPSILVNTLHRPSPNLYWYYQW